MCRKAVVQNLPADLRELSSRFRRDLSQGRFSLIVLNIVQWIALYDTNVCFHPLPPSLGIFSLITDKSFLIQFVIILDLLVTIVNGKEFMIVNKRLGLGM